MIKHMLTVLVLVGLVTGCSPSKGNTTTANPFAANNTTSGNLAAPSSGNQSSSNGSTMTDSQMKSIAKGLVERYIRSHNDKTLPEYKVDVRQFLIPGLASAVGGIASSGQDYNHPVASYTITVTQVHFMNPKQFLATSPVIIHFKNGKIQHLTYHLKLIQSNQQWYIESIA